MEEKENPVTQTEEKTEVKENVKTNEEVKTFTQEQVNSMLAKERKGLPSKEELESYNAWKESQKSEVDKRKEQEEKTQKDLQEGIAAKRELEVLKADVSKDFSGYVAYEVGKMDGDFKENLTKYLKDHPKFLQSNETTTVVKRTSASMTGKVQTNVNETNKIMNDIIRNAKK